MHVYMVAYTLEWITMKPDWYNYTICDYYASALINGDYSGMDDKEKKLVDDWIDSLPNNVSHLSGFDSDDDKGFCVCDISGKAGNCYGVRAIIK